MRPLERGKGRSKRQELNARRSEYSQQTLHNAERNNKMATSALLNALAAVECRTYAEVTASVRNRVTLLEALELLNPEAAESLRPAGKRSSSAEESSVSEDGIFHCTDMVMCENHCSGTGG